MPAHNNSKSGSSGRKFRTTDKCVEAEMKNKMEAARLLLQKKFLSRQQSHHSFMVEKDKRKAITQLWGMRKTSGLSMHGEPPNGPSDTSHEQSPYFKTYQPLSEKRLVQWRAKEIELERILAQDPDILIPAWERDPNEDLGEKFGKTMRMLGYNVDDEDMKKAQEHSMKPPTKIKPRTNIKPVDVFECLRKPEESTGLTSNGATGYSTRKPKPNENFSITGWSKQLMNDYKKSIAQPNLPRHKLRRVSSAMPRMQTINDEPPSVKPAWNKQHGGKVPQQTDVTDSCQKSSASPIRPHTAFALGQRTHAILRKRPISADKSHLISHPDHKPTFYIGEEQETETENGNKPQDLANNSDHGDIHVINDGKSLTNGVSSNKNSNINSRGDTDPSYLRKTCSSSSFKRSSSSSTNPNTPRCTSSEGYFDTQDPSQRKRDPRELLSDRSQGCGRGGDTNKKLSKKDSMFLLSSVLGAQKESRVSFTEENDDAPTSSNHKQGSSKKQTHTMEQVVKMRRQGSKLSDMNIDELGENLESLSGLHSNHVDELFQKMPSAKDKHKQDIQLTKAERKIALHANHRKNISHNNDLDPLDDIDDSDEDDEDLTPGRRMPQWKRDLMAEAPPGLFGPKTPAKVVVAMSKAQRKRELEDLVTENVSDVKRITEKEHGRRIRARLHLFFTMHKFEEAVDKTSGDKNNLH